MNRVYAGISFRGSWRSCGPRKRTIGPPRLFAPTRNVKSSNVCLDHQPASSARRSGGSGTAEDRAPPLCDRGRKYVMNLIKYEICRSGLRRRWTFRGYFGPTPRSALLRFFHAEGGTPMASKWMCKVQDRVELSQLTSVPPITNRFPETVTLEKLAEPVVRALDICGGQRSGGIRCKVNRRNFVLAGTRLRDGEQPANKSEPVTA